MNVQFAVTLVFGVLIVGVVVLLAVMLWGRQRLQQLAVQERIAMIERGLVPSPETDPAAFDRLLNSRRPPSRVALRFQSAGVMIMGLGVAMAVLLTFVARLPNLGLGIGGAIAVVGLTTALTGILVGANPNPPPPPPGA